MTPRPPDQEGRLAKAWKSRAEGVRPDHDAAIAQWVVTGKKHETTPADWAGPFHIAWNWWYVACISLRDIEGAPPANKVYPEAEYEFIILSINPEIGEPKIDEAESLQFLSPADVVEQFHGVTDEQAAEIVEAAVKAICEGMISPDQDFRAGWKRIIQTTVDHYRRGIH